MSFYLLPAASYQTQQKLKEQMEGKKKELQKRKVSSSSKHKSSKSSAPSISAPSINSASRTPRSSISSSGNDNFMAPGSRKMSSISSDSRSSTESSRSAPRKHGNSPLNSPPHSKADDDSLYDNYTHLDTISTRKSTSENSTLSSSTVGSGESTRRPSAASSSYNYSMHSEMKEILKVSKQHALQKKSRRADHSDVTSASDSFTKMSIQEDSEFNPHEHDIKVQFKNVDFQGDQVTANSIAEAPGHSSEDGDEDSDSESKPNLTRVYSNVSSIFSTKGKPSIYNSVSASTSHSGSPTGTSSKHSNDSLSYDSKSANKFSRFKKKFSV